MAVVYGAIRPSTKSIELQVERLDDRGPSADVGFDDLGELLWQAAERVAGEPVEGGFHLGGLQSDIDGAVELADHLGWRTGRRQQAGPGAGRKIRKAAFDHG